MPISGNAGGEDESREQRRERMIAEEMQNRMKVIRLAGKGAAGIVAVIVALNSFYTVNQSQRGIHTRMGAIVGVSAPGMHFKFPIIDGVRKLNVRTHTIQWQNVNGQDSRMETYSKDQQPADIAMTVTWSPALDDKSIVELYTKYGSIQGFEQAVLIPSAQEAFKNVFGGYDSVNAIQKRALLNAQTSGEVARITKGKPFRLESVQIQDISFSNAYEQAVEARMTAQVNVEKKTQEKITSQIEADMMVIDAEAKAKAVRLAGDAEADAIKAKADAIASNARLVEYTAAQRWNGELPTTMVPGGALPFVKIGQ